MMGSPTTQGDTPSSQSTDAKTAEAREASPSLETGDSQTPVNCGTKANEVDNVITETTESNGEKDNKGCVRDSDEATKGGSDQPSEQEIPSRNMKNDDYLSHAGISWKEFENMVQEAILVGPGASAIEPLGEVTPTMKRMEYKGKTKVCTNCGVSTTPCWRKGPLGSGTLCNACGLKFKNSNLRLNPFTGAAVDKALDEISVKPSKHEYKPSSRRRSGVADRSRSSRRSTPKKSRTASGSSSRARTSSSVSDHPEQQQQQQQQQEQQQHLSPNPLLAEHMRFGVSFTRQKRERRKPKYLEQSSSDEEQRPARTTPSRRATPRKTSRVSNSVTRTSAATVKNTSPSSGSAHIDESTVDGMAPQKPIRTYARKRRSLSKSTVVSRDSASEASGFADRSVLAATLTCKKGGKSTTRRSSYDADPAYVDHSAVEEYSEVDSSTIDDPISAFGRASLSLLTESATTTTTTTAAAAAASSKKSARRRGRPRGSRNRNKIELESLVQIPRTRRKRGRPPKSDQHVEYVDHGDFMLAPLDGNAQDYYLYIDDDYSWYSDSSVFSDDGILNKRRRQGFRAPHVSPSPIFRLPAKQIVNIMSFLDARSLSRCSMVCYAWRALALMPILWQQLYDKKFTINYDSLSNYSGLIDWRQLYVARCHISLFSPIEQAEYMCKFYAVERKPKLLECIIYRAHTELHTAHSQIESVNPRNKESGSALNRVEGSSAEIEPNGGVSSMEVDQQVAGEGMEPTLM